MLFILNFNFILYDWSYKYISALQEHDRSRWVVCALWEKQAQMFNLLWQVKKSFVSFISLITRFCFEAPFWTYRLLIVVVSRPAVLLSCRTGCVSDAIWNPQEEIQQGSLQVFFIWLYILTNKFIPFLGLFIWGLEWISTNYWVCCFFSHLFLQ